MSAADKTTKTNALCAELHTIYKRKIIVNMLGWKQNVQPKNNNSQRNPNTKMINDLSIFVQLHYIRCNKAEPYAPFKNWKESVNCLLPHTNPRTIPTFRSTVFHSDRIRFVIVARVCVAFDVWECAFSDSHADSNLFLICSLLFSNSAKLSVCTR